MKRQLSLLPLVGIIYFTVSGGAFGLEDLIAGTGPGLALVLLVVTPLLWSVPISLVTAEMAAMLPLEGGYYRWVYFALGRGWGFQEGWWTWLYTFIDMAIYPVLFTTYLKFFLPGLTGWRQWLVSLLVILTSLIINLRGAKSVGYSAVLAFVAVTVPFLLLTWFGAMKMAAPPWHPFLPGGTHKLSETLGLGLTAVMWSYMGWDNVSTFASEVKHPGRTFPLAMLLAVLLVTVLYLLPISAALGASGNWQEWNSDSFPISKVAGQIVGPWLGSLVSLGVMASLWSMYNSQLLYTSRLPFAMAEDALLPRAITKLHPKWETPYISLILCSAIYALFAQLSFRKLVIIDVLIYAISLLLEFAALVVLRRKRPDLARPFKIPGGWIGVWLTGGALTAFVLTCLVFTLIGSEDSWQQVVITAGLLATGPLLYFLLGKKRGTAPENATNEWLRRLVPAGD